MATTKKAATKAGGKPAAKKSSAKKSLEIPKVSKEITMGKNNGGE